MILKWITEKLKTIIELLEAVQRYIRNDRFRK